MLNAIEMALALVLLGYAISIVVPMWRCQAALVPVRIIVLAFWCVVNSGVFMVMEWRWVSMNLGAAIPTLEDILWSSLEMSALLWQIVMVRTLVGFVHYGCSWSGR